MGAKSSHQYSFVSQTEISHFGNVRIYQDNLNCQFFTQTYSFLVEPQVQSQFIEHLKNKNNSYIELERANYCSNSTKIHVTFQYFPHTLQQLLDRNYPFTERQTIKILYQLLAAVNYLNENDSYHGDICPQVIYLNLRNAKYSYIQIGDHLYRIFDSAYFKPLLNGYYRAQKEKTYSSPQVLTNLGQKRVYPLYNHQTSDIFSIGLVILYCMSGVNPLGAYTSKYQIDFYYIESMFRLAERKEYNEDLINLIRDCLKQRNRPTALEALEIFQDLNLTQQLQNNSIKYSLKRPKTMNSFLYE